MKSRVLGRLPLLAVIAGALAVPLLGQVPSRVVAYSGLPAPGASPAVFDGFHFVAIAPQGGVVFRGRLATGSNTYGIWRESSDPVTPVLSLVQREGTPSPLPGFSFSVPGPPTINLPGHFAFKGHVTNGPTFPDTLWVEKPAPTGLTLIAREGAPAPGLAGVDFGILFVHAGYDPLLLDTRLPDGPLGGPALGGAERSFAVAANCGIPATAKAVSANITVTGRASQGHLSLYPAGFGLPLVSSINFRAGQTRANNVTLPLGTGGAITVQAALIGGTVHFILDVNGYYE